MCTWMQMGCGNVHDLADNVYGLLFVGDSILQIIFHKTFPDFNTGCVINLFSKLSLGKYLYVI